MKTLHCADAGFDCKAVIQAATNEEIMTQVATHAEEAHGVNVTPELAEKVEALIKDEKEEVFTNS